MTDYWLSVGTTLGSADLFNRDQGAAVEACKPGDDGAAEQRAHLEEAAAIDGERQIVDGLIKGQSNKTIARACGITEATVKVHMKAILRKVPCSNRTQVAIWALAHIDVFRAPRMNGASVALSLGLAK